MLDWLKSILGDSYTEDIDTKVSQAIGKNFVAKSDFNAKSDALKKAEGDLSTRDQQLEDLRNSTGDIDALRQQITDLQNQNATDKQNYEAELAQVRLNNAVEAALTASGAKNNTAVKALLAEFLKDAKLADDGTVKGLSAELAEMAKAEETAFLFNTAGGTKFKGVKPGQSGGNPPPEFDKEPKDMN